MVTFYRIDFVHLSRIGDKSESGAPTDVHAVSSSTT